MKVKTVYVEITNQCNLNCRTCYNRSGLNRERRELSAARLEEILQVFLPYGLERFLLSGGEPTLHTEFDSVLDLVGKYPQISFGIVTNGTNPNRKLAGYVNDGKMSLQISLDGSCEEENAKTRGPGNFEKTIAFARQIHNTKEPPLLKMVLSQQNRGDLEAFYRLARSIGFSPEFAFIYKSGNGTENWEGKALTARQKLEALPDDPPAESGMWERGLPCPCAPWAAPSRRRIRSFPYASRWMETSSPARPFTTADSPWGTRLIFTRRPLPPMWRSSGALARRRLETDYGCKTCLLQEGCLRGCMAAAVCLCGDPLGDDGECEYRKLQFLGFDLQGMLKKHRAVGTERSRAQASAGIRGTMEKAPVSGALGGGGLLNGKKGAEMPVNYEGTMEKIRALAEGSRPDSETALVLYERRCLPLLSPSEIPKGKGGGVQGAVCAEPGLPPGAVRGLPGSV